jgi:hypothetical protein
LNRLSDHHLIAAYNKSIELGLDPLFINMLKQEVNRRKLDRTPSSSKNHIKIPKKAPCQSMTGCFLLKNQFHFQSFFLTKEH